MGIQGLLPLLKSIMVPIHIKDLEGSSVAIDTYSWLHKGAFSCSKELCNGLPTSKHIDYCMHRINLLRHHGVKPVLVFDGGLLPMKNEQEIKRARTRKENLARAIEHETNGNSAAAYECYQKAVDITPLIAHGLIQVLKRENISYVVAPYEADAQMTFLAISNQVDAVLTEDSDLIPFGCPRIIFKMDKFGQGVEFRYDMLQKNKDLNFAGFTKQMILEMCILSGCDYLPSLPGMGLKRAHALIKKFASYDKVIRHLRYNTVSVPHLYEESFKKAILTFQHQWVYDPITEDIVHLSQISNNIEDDLDFLGPLIPQYIAKGIAEGDIDPCTNLPFQEQNINTGVMHERPYKLKEFNAGSVKKKLDLPVQKNVLTKYFCFASLEAKRKFRAPKQSANQPSFRDDSSVSVEEPVGPEDSCLLASNNHCENVEGCLSTYPVRNGNADGIPLSDSCNQNKDMVNNKMEGTEHILLQQHTQSIHKPCVTSHKKPDCEKFPDTTGEEVRKENKRVIVRSSYFKHKPESNDEQDDNQKLSDQKNAAAAMLEITTPEVASFISNSCDSSITKRKISPNESIQMDNVKTKHLCKETLQSDHVLGKKTEEGKFGSNISHLSHYSDIAEKSMERFVSVISSFSFTSGSRASGLRAPLRDVQNSNSIRSTPAMDFSQFAYVPNKHRDPLKFRKGRR
ncbi:exonuclease 1 isoform X2 [Benincasa hispida]|uniref:exonuclease 1 isoform X2 n=1 Tax=Benincasa hispida TaxID=102211 RepID=UPI0019001AC9|nr:exonuclease 1 isoform X2 [Benincasa hispida]